MVERGGRQGGLPAALSGHQAVDSSAYRKRLGLCYGRTAVSDAGIGQHNIITHARYNIITVLIDLIINTRNRDNIRYM